MSTDAIVPHLVIPFRIESNGSASVHEQDSVDDVAQCVQNLLTTRLGERLELPGYGIPDLVFDGEFNHALIAAEIERWEPRAVTVLSSSPNNLDDLIRDFEIRVSARSM